MNALCQLDLLEERVEQRSGLLPFFPAYFWVLVALAIVSAYGVRSQGPGFLAETTHMVSSRPLTRKMTSKSALLHAAMPLSGQILFLCKHMYVHRFMTC